MCINCLSRLLIKISIIITTTKIIVESAFILGSTPRRVIEKILIDKAARDNELITAIKKSGAHYQFVDKIVLDKMSEGNHQGFVAIVSEFEYCDLDDITGDVVLILDGVEDPHNLGNIIRTAECMGVAGVIIPKNRSASVTETVIKVSAGATAHMKITKVTNVNHAIEALKKRDYWVYACELGGTDLVRQNLTGKTAIVMGGENTGVSSLTRKLCDGVVTIKMHGRVNSLNVANAAAMVLYEVNRQKT